MAVLVWKCLHGQAPRYLADLCVSTAFTLGRQQLRSAATGVLVLQRTSPGHQLPSAASLSTDLDMDQSAGDTALATSVARHVQG